MRKLIPAPDRSAIADPELADYDALLPFINRADADRQEYPGSDVFGALLNSPPAARAIVGVGTAILGRDGAKVPAEFHQFGDMVVCLELHRLRSDGAAGCELRAMYNHLPEALRVGVRPEAIRALLDGDDAALDGTERLCASFVRGVLLGQLAEETMTDMEDRLGRRVALEYGLLVLLVLYFIRAEELVGCSSPSFDEVVARFEALVEPTKASG